jgi:hypothetical protein
MVGKQVAQEHFSVLPKEHFTGKIPSVDLCHRLSTTTTGRNNPVTRDRYDCIDLGLPVRQHLGDCSHLSTESKSTPKINTDPRVNITLHCPNSGTNPTGGEILSKLHFADHGTCRCDQF